MVLGGFRSFHVLVTTMLHAEYSAMTFYICRSRGCGNVTVAQCPFASSASSCPTDRMVDPRPPW